MRYGCPPLHLCDNAHCPSQIRLGYTLEVVKNRFNLELAMKSLLDIVTAFKGCRSGSTAIEYALIATLIAVVIVGAVTLLGSSVNNLFTTTANVL